MATDVAVRGTSGKANQRLSQKPVYWCYSVFRFYFSICETVAQPFIFLDTCDNFDNFDQYDKKYTDVLRM